MSREPRSPRTEIIGLAGQQRGVITRAQCLAAGMSSAAIDRAIHAGRLHPLFRGVYLVGHPVPAPLALETAALLAGGPTAAITHASALFLDGLLPAPREVHITVPDRRCRRQPGLHPHHAPLPADVVQTVRGLRATRTTRTLRDLRLLMDPDDLERLTNEAEVQGLIPRRPGPGITRKELERRFRILLLRAGLTPTATNTHTAGYEVDVLFAAQRLIVELDGDRFHRTRAARERDAAKQADLVAAGYRVIRFTWRQVTEQPERTIALLARALGESARS